MKITIHNLINSQVIAQAMVSLYSEMVGALVGTGHKIGNSNKTPVAFA